MKMKRIIILISLMSLIFVNSVIGDNSKNIVSVRISSTVTNFDIVLYDNIDHLHFDKVYDVKGVKVSEATYRGLNYIQIDYLGYTSWTCYEASSNKNSIFIRVT